MAHRPLAGRGGEQRLEPLIVANKRDRVDEAAFQEWFGEYQKIGYRVLATSTRGAEGVDALRLLLNGRVSAFTGPSVWANPACSIWCSRDCAWRPVRSAR